MILTIRYQERHQHAELLTRISEKVGALSGINVDLTNFDSHLTVLIYIDYTYGVTGIVFVEENKNEWSLILMNLIDEMSPAQTLLVSARFSRAVYETVYLLAQDSKIDKVYIQENYNEISNLKALKWPFLMRTSKAYLNLKKSAREHYRLSHMSLLSEIETQMSNLRNVVYIDDWKKTKNTKSCFSV
jgi:hypothetical protein